MINNKIISKKYYLIFTLYFLGFGILIAIIVSFVNYKLSFAETEKKFQAMANTEIISKINYLNHYISQTQMLLNSAANSDFTRDYIRFHSSINKKNLNDIFYALANSNKDIMQLRYIDTEGKEKIRVDRDISSQNVKIISGDKLQNKGQRYYFKEASKLQEKQFWHSNIDLNVEQGQIEVPFRPTFRVARKIIIDGQFEGIVIANLLFKDTIEILSHSKNFNIYLIDKNGEIIHTPNHENSWSKYLKNGNSLKKVFPKDEKNILNNSTYATETLYSFSTGELLKNNDGLKIVLNTKIDVQNQFKEQNTLAAFIVALTVLVVSIPLSWIVSIIPSRLQTELSNSYEKIRKSSKIIDKYVMIARTDTKGITTDISKKFTSITGYSRSEIIGKKHALLRHQNTDEDIYTDLWETISSGNVWENEIKEIDKFGKEFWIHIVITPEFNSLGVITGYTEIAQDITDKKIIEQMSKTDHLTQLFNRREIESLIKSEITRYARYATNFSILFIDIDKFKTVNDTFGHNIGDEVLIKISQILKSNSRETDTVGRWGGEEFIIISAQTDIDGAFDFANLLREKIENYNFPTVKKITISCGVAQFKENDNTTSIISKADDALYCAKENGRNRVERV